MLRTPRLFLIPLATLAPVAAACGDDDDSGVTTTMAPTTAAPAAASAVPAFEGDVTVFAATSLTGAFNEIGTAFTAANPDAEVTFSFDGSSALVQQITQGAPADVFASADTNNMTKLTDAGLNGTAPQILATNVLTIIVAPGNPLGITGVADLASPAIKVVTCATEVPCGNYANQVFASAGVTVSPVSLEQNVGGVRTKVTSGEADAGIVYLTDAIAAGDEAANVEIPEDINVVAEYPVATVAASANAALGEGFIEFLLGDEAQGILADHGFGPPS